MKDLDNQPEEKASLKITGHILIKDDETGEIILDKLNALHPENMSVAVAQSLAHMASGPIEFLNFGNGGATVSGIGTVTYLSPNTVGASATLYNQTYQKIVDGLNVNNLDPTRNNIVVSHVTGNLFSDIIVSCILDTGEPNGQDAFDNSTNMNAEFVFNEIGLQTYGGLLISHAIFSPVQKALNRIFNITYTIRIQLV